MGKPEWKRNKDDPRAQKKAKRTSPRATTHKKEQPKVPQASGAMEVKECNGTVVLFHKDRKYGFIRIDSGEHDVFFHMNHVVGRRVPEINQPVKVKFEPSKRKEGTFAAKAVQLF